jgi:hypothetical protein
VFPQRHSQSIDHSDGLDLDEPLRQRERSDANKRDRPIPVMAVSA